jgi:putative tricarboxylic transport membrane protein
VGAYSLNSNLWDIAVMIFFGVLGHVMRKAGFEGAPMILSLVIGQMFENAFRQSLLLGDGNFLIFARRPISAVLIAISVFLILTAAFRRKIPQTV